MEFWGVEVKPGQKLKCEPGDEKYLHLSQASLGVIKKDKGKLSVPLFLTVDGQKHVIGTLSSDNCAQISYDLVFEKDFELSHNWKDGSVYFSGYKTITGDNCVSDLSDTDSENEEDEEDIPLLQKTNAKPSPDDELNVLAKSKSDGPTSKAKPKVEEQIKPEANNDESDESDEDMFDEDDSDEADSDEDGSDDNGEDEDDSSDEEEKVTPKKNQSGKKRAAGSDSKTSAPEKKAKLVTPAGKSAVAPDSKKGNHTATPYPTKQAGKTPANDAKSKPQTPKSGGSISCKSCTKTFNSEVGLLSHTKAKHSDAK